jgi:hypothetical protein
MYQIRIFHCLPSSDRWTDGLHESGPGGLSAALLFVLSEQLGKILDIAESSINNLDLASLGTSLFFFANGLHPKFSVITENSGICALDDFIVDLQEIQEKVIECLTQAKKRQALYHDLQGNQFHNINWEI